MDLTAITNELNDFNCDPSRLDPLFVEVNEHSERISEFLVADREKRALELK
jgi:hypothetical protein